MKKNIMAMMAIATALICICCAGAFGSDESSADPTKVATIDSNGLSYEVYDDGTAKLIECSNLSGNLIVPATVTHNETVYNVTAADSFESNKTINSIEFLSPSITPVDNMFNKCTGLLTVKINPTVITTYMFGACTKLTTVVIGGEATVISDRAFNNCSKLVDLTVPSTITTVGKYAFYSNAKLENFSIPNVTLIDNDAFYGCKALTAIPTGSKVTTYNAEAFRGCIGLTSVNITGEDLTFGISVFNGCTGLVEASITGMSSIPNTFMNGCKKLTTVTLGSEISSIGQSAFNGCSALSSLSITGNVTSIAGQAFQNCTGLRSLGFDLDSVEMVTTGAFTGSGLTDVLIIGGVVHFVPLGMTEVTIPDGVVGIGPSAFAGSSIASITIPASLVSIGDKAFNKCVSLTSVQFASGSVLAEIGTSSFEGCTSLASFDSPATLQSCGSKAFYGTAIATAIIGSADGGTLYWAGVGDAVVPAGVKVIAGYSVSPLVTSISLPEGIKTFATYAFYESGIRAILIPSTVDVMDNRAFSKSAIESIHIPDNITYISQYCFNDCPNLVTVTLPSTLTTLNNYAFQSCVEMETITIPASVTVIGSSVFKGCSSMESATFLGNPSIGTNLFHSCTSLTTVSFAPGVAEIPDGMFNGCSMMSGITIPDTVTAIGSNAFSSSGITELTIPASVTSVGSAMCNSCDLLRSVKICPEYLSLKTNVFAGCRVLDTVEFCGSVSMVSTSFKNVTTITTVILHNAAPMSDLNFISSVETIKYEGEDGNTYIPVKMSDGINLTDGVMLIAKGEGALTIPSDVTAINVSAVSGVLNVADATIAIEEGGIFSYVNGILSSNGHVIFVNTEITEISISEGITAIDAFAVSKDSKAETAWFPASLETISSGSWSSTALVKAFFRSTPAVAADSGLPSTASYYRSADVSGAIANINLAGVFIPATSGNVIINTNDPHCTVTAYEEDGNVVFWIQPMEGYTQSVVSVESGSGSPMLKSTDPAMTVDGHPIMGGYLLTGVASDAVVNVTGIELNAYAVTLPENPGLTITVSGDTSAVIHGSRFIFSIEIADGYTATPEFSLAVNGVVVAPVFTAGGLRTYETDVAGGIIITVNGVAANTTHTVSFQTNGGSAIDSQSVAGGQRASIATPTRSGFVFKGWYTDAECTVRYDFNAPVNAPMTLYAGWFDESDPKVTVSFSGIDSVVSATVDGWREASSGEPIFIGSRIVFEADAAMGYEISWTVNGSRIDGCSRVLELDVTDVLSVSSKAVWSIHAPYYNHYDLVTPLPGHYEFVWSSGGGNTSGMTFTGMTYLPSILGDYAYAKKDNYLIKIDIGTGEVLAGVMTAPSYSGFYEYVCTGNGYVLDCLTGKVFDADLNQKFVIDKTSTRCFYHDGRFFVAATGGTYCFAAEDQDPESDANIQTSVWNAPIGQAISNYEGGATILFDGGYLYTIGYNGASDPCMITADYRTGALIDTLVLTELNGMMINSGYTDLNQGYASLGVYASGIFDAGGGPIKNIAVVKLTDDGYFDRATLKVISSNTGSSYCSGPMIQDGKVYVYASGRFQVYNLSTMGLIAQTEDLSSKIGGMHGSMAITTGVPGKVCGYVIPYNSSRSLFGFIFDLSTEAIESFELENAASAAQYASGQVRFASNGYALWVNDSGTLFCARYVQDVSISRDAIALEVEDTQSLSAEVDPTAVFQDVVWSSSNESVATVASDGRVTAIGNGTATITATAGSFHATCTVIVGGVFDITYMVGETEFHTETHRASEAFVPTDRVPVKAADRINTYAFSGWDGYTEGMVITSDITFNAMFEPVTRPVESYSFMIDDSTGENAAINGWYTADGADALDAFMNALDAANIAYTFEYGTGGVFFGPSATFGGLTVGAWASDGNLYNSNFAVWNWNAESGWFMGNTFGTDSDKVYIISHEKYIDAYWNGEMSRRIGFVGPYSIIPGTTAEIFAYDGRTGGYADVEDAAFHAYLEYMAGYGYVDVDLSAYGLTCIDEDYEGMELLGWYSDCVDAGDMDASRVIPGFSTDSASWGWIQRAPQDPGIANYRDTVFGPTTYRVSFVSEGTEVGSFEGFLNETIVKPAAPSKASTRANSYVFAGWDGCTDGMRIAGNATFAAAFDEVARPVESYSFMIDDSTGENAAINGWYTADGADALDAFMNALDAANIAYTFEYGTGGVFFGPSATFGGLTVGAWASDGNLYNSNFAVWNWNAESGWFMGNTFGTDPDKVYIISHEKYIDASGNGEMSRRIGYVNGDVSGVIPGFSTDCASWGWIQRAPQDPGIANYRDTVFGPTTYRVSFVFDGTEIGSSSGYLNEMIVKPATVPSKASDGLYDYSFTWMGYADGDVFAEDAIILGAFDRVPSVTGSEVPAYVEGIDGKAGFSKDEARYVSESGKDAILSIGDSSVELPASVMHDIFAEHGSSVSVTIGKVDKSHLTESQKSKVGDRPVVSIDLDAGGVKIHNLGGKVVVTLHYVLQDGESADNVIIYHLTDSGTLEEMETTYDAESGTVSFTTDHFSMYVIGYEDGDDKNGMVALFVAIAAILLLATVSVVILKRLGH